MLLALQGRAAHGEPAWALLTLTEHKVTHTDVERLSLTASKPFGTRTGPPPEADGGPSSALQDQTGSPQCQAGSLLCLQEHTGPLRIRRGPSSALQDQTGSPRIRRGPTSALQDQAGGPLC